MTLSKKCQQVNPHVVGRRVVNVRILLMGLTMSLKRDTRTKNNNNKKIVDGDVNEKDKDTEIEIETENRKQREMGIHIYLCIFSADYMRYVFQYSAVCWLRHTWHVTIKYYSLYPYIFR